MIVSKIRSTVLNNYIHHGAREVEFYYVGEKRDYTLENYPYIYISLHRETYK